MNSAQHLSKSNDRAKFANISRGTSPLCQLPKTKRCDFQIQLYGKEDFITDELKSQKLEADCIRFKLASEDATKLNDSLEKQVKLLSDQCSAYKFDLNSERAQHVQAVAHAHALAKCVTHIKLQCDKYEQQIETKNSEILLLEKQLCFANQQQKTESSQIDSLTKICKALEEQMRKVLSKSGDPEKIKELDIAEKWRNEAYKCMVQMHHTNLEHKNSRRSQESKPTLKSLPRMPLGPKTTSSKTE